MTMAFGIIAFTFFSFLSFLFFGVYGENYKSLLARLDVSSCLQQQYAAIVAVQTHVSRPEEVDCEDELPSLAHALAQKKIFVKLQTYLVTKKCIVVCVDQDKRHQHTENIAMKIVPFVRTLNNRSQKLALLTYREPCDRPIQDPRGKQIDSCLDQITRFCNSRRVAIYFHLYDRFRQARHDTFALTHKAYKDAGCDSYQNVHLQMLKHIQEEYRHIVQRQEHEGATGGVSVCSRQEAGRRSKRSVTTRSLCKLVKNESDIEALKDNIRSPNPKFVGDVIVLPKGKGRKHTKRTYRFDKTTRRYKRIKTSTHEEWMRKTVPNYVQPFQTSISGSISNGFFGGLEGSETTYENIDWIFLGYKSDSADPFAKTGNIPFHYEFVNFICNTQCMWLEGILFVKTV